MAAPQVGSPGHSGRRLLKDSVASVLDQGMLSALNLVLGLMLIRLTTRDSYGLYSQLYVAGILAATLTEALITGPLTTLAPGLGEERRRRFIAHLDRYQRQLSGLFAALAGLITGAVVAYLRLDTHPVALGLAFAAYVWAASLREFSRSVGFVEGRALAVLRMDGWFALAVVAGLGLLAWIGWVNLPAVMLVLALSNLAALSLRAVPGSEDPAGRAEAVHAVWQRGKWALPGAVLAWLTNYSYLYLSAIWLGVGASADLNASRLLLMPVALLVLAWSRVARPHAVRLMRDRQMQSLTRFILASVVAMEVITVVYSGLLWLTLPWLEAHVLGAKYADLEPFIVAWGVYFAIYSARWIGTSLLTSGDRYRMLMMSALLCLVVMVLAASYALPRWGAWGAVAALALVELIDVMLVWLVLLPRARRDLLNGADLAVDSRLS